MANYYKQLYSLSVLMAMLEKEGLPFYEEDDHETMTEDEQVEVY